MSRLIPAEQLHRPACGRFPYRALKDRYFLVPMLDGWTNVFQVPRKRTTGTGAQTYAAILAPT